MMAKRQADFGGMQSEGFDFIGPNIFGSYAGRGMFSRFIGSSNPIANPSDNTSSFLEALLWKNRESKVRCMTFVAI